MCTLRRRYEQACAHIRYLLCTIHMYSLLRPGRARCLLCRTAPAYCGCSSPMHAARPHGALGAVLHFCGHVLSLLACALARMHDANNRIPFTITLTKHSADGAHALVTRCGGRQRDRERERERPDHYPHQANTRTDIRGGRAVRPLLPSEPGSSPRDSGSVCGRSPRRGLEVSLQG